MTPTTPDAIGRYKVLKALPAGGMGQVYLALDADIDRKVAIKVLLADNPETRRRFILEARAAGNLRHQNIVAIFDVGQHEGRPFIAMEYIGGATLEDAIHQHEPMSLDRKLELMEALCAGLQYAHKNGIIHRDIKPANLMLDDDGVLKILDFGIARRGEGTLSETQQKPKVIGSLNYIAPEQLLSQPLDGRADIFSAGAVFYELLSGRQAHPGELPGVLGMILQRQPEPLAQLVPGLPQEVIDVVERCIAKDRDDRFPDMAVLRREVADIRQRLLRIRGEQIELYLADANKALAAGALQDAIDACEQALVLDPEHPRVLALKDRVRRGLQVKQHDALIVEAKTKYEGGAYTEASLLVERVLSVLPESPEAMSLRKAIDDARQKAEADALAKAIDGILSRGREALAKGDLIAAAAAATDALGRDGKHAAALAFKREVTQAVQTKREAEDASRRVAEARSLFDKQEHQAAFHVLESAAPHPLVTDALGELRLKFQEIERLRKEVGLKVEEATLRFGRRDYPGALALVTEVLEREPTREDARAIKKQIEAALVEERRIANAITEAKTLVSTGRFKAGLDALEVVAKHHPSAPGLQDLRKEAQEGLAAEVRAQARKQFDAHMNAAERAAKAEDWALAFEQIQHAVAIEPKNPAALALMEKIATGLNAAKLAGKTVVIGGKTVVLPAQGPGPTPLPLPVVGPPAPPAPRIGDAGKGKTVVIHPGRDPGDAPLHRPVAGKTIERTPPGPVPVPAPAPNRMPLYAIAGAALVAIAAVVVWLMQPAPEPPPDTNTQPVVNVPTPTQPVDPAVPAAVNVSITIIPWARIESITNREGQPVMSGPPLETPMVLSLRPGEYRARATHPNYSRPLEFSFTVQPGVPAAITQTMPDFRLDQEIESVLGAPAR